MKNKNKTSIQPLSDAIQKQPTNRPTCRCKNKISEEFKDLPVIPARRLQNMNIDMNAASEGAIQKSSGSKVPTAEKVVLPETQKTQTMVDDFSSREQKNFKMRFMNIYNKILNKIKNNIQSGSIK
jgi:hypothetical protein